MGGDARRRRSRVRTGSQCAGRDEKGWAELGLTALCVIIRRQPRRAAMYRDSGPKVLLFSIASLFTAGLILVACEREGPAERAGKDVDRATKDAGKAVEDAGKKMQEGTRK